MINKLYWRFYQKASEDTMSIRVAPVDIWLINIWITHDMINITTHRGVVSTRDGDYALGLNGMSCLVDKHMAEMSGRDAPCD